MLRLTNLNTLEALVAILLICDDHSIIPDQDRNVSVSVQEYDNLWCKLISQETVIEYIAGQYIY